jgi:hypothetical protein
MHLGETHWLPVIRNHPHYSFPLTGGRTEPGFSGAGLEAPRR